jgi:glyceraldehyde-3-phosphate dehydrogenase/erythrose-4-phosphate dehydrogenase
MITPLGVPVLPEVNIIYATLSGEALVITKVLEALVDKLSTRAPEIPITFVVSDSNFVAETF